MSDLPALFDPEAYDDNGMIKEERMATGFATGMVIMERARLARAKQRRRDRAEWEANRHLKPEPFEDIPGALDCLNYYFKHRGDQHIRLEDLPRWIKEHMHRTTGRNDPCPCGCGKKFKKCHGRV